MNRMPKWLPYVLIGMLLLLLLPNLLGPEPPARFEVPYSEFKQMVADGEVEEVTLRGEEAVVVFKQPMPIGPMDGMSDRATTRIPAIGDPDLLPALEAQGVKITSLADQDGPGRWFASFLPWLILLAVYFWFWNRMQRNIAGRFGGRDFGEFLAGSARRAISASSSPARRAERRRALPRSPSTTSLVRTTPSAKWPSWSTSCVTPNATAGWAPSRRAACC
jgi:cell division protease FtsH